MHLGIPFILRYYILNNLFGGIPVLFYSSFTVVCSGKKLFRIFTLDFLVFLFEI